MRAKLLLALLRRVSLPHLRAHWLRSCLAIAGVGLGVTTFVAVADLSESVLASFRRAVETIAGPADLEVSSPSGSLDEAVVERVAAAHGVAAAAAVIETFVPSATEPGTSFYLLGTDFLDSPLWQTQVPRSALTIPDEFGFIANLDSVALTRSFAERHGLTIGSEVGVIATGGPVRLRVRGLLDDVPAARLFGGALALMDLPGAEHLLGREGRIDRVAVGLLPGTAVASARSALQSLLGDGFAVEPPRSRGQQAEMLLLSLRGLLLCQSFAAIIVGGLLVHHTVVSSIRQRRRLFAILNATGIEQSVIVALCLTETALLGAVGAALGLLAGGGLARAVAGALGEAASAIWLRLDVAAAAPTRGQGAAALLIGVGVACVAALLALRAALSGSTIEALRPAAAEVEEPRQHLRWSIVGLMLIAATWLIVLLPRSASLLAIVLAIGATQAAGFTGGALLAPALVAAAGSLARRMARGSISVALRLAAENLPRTPGRSGVTVATIAAALGLGIGLATVVQSFSGAWLGWIDQHFAADLMVGAGGRLELLGGPPMADEVRRTIAGTEGVRDVEALRVRDLVFDGRPIRLLSISLPERLAHGGLAMTEGSFAEAARELEAGTGVLLSDNLAYRSGLHRGDGIDIPTPRGVVHFEVAGTYVDYLGSLDLGAVVVSRDQLRRLWDDDTASLFRLWLQPGASPEVVGRAVLARLGSSAGYYALTSREFVDAVRSTLARFFQTAWALVVVGALVGVIGMINAQMSTVLDRRLEIATLRAVGVARRDLLGAVALESGALGLLGGLCGVAIGGMLGAQALVVVVLRLTGWRIPLEWPVAAFATGIVLAALLSTVAGAVPARLAGRAATVRPSLD